MIEHVKFDEKGLVPAIAQDAETGEVLMMAWMNDEALRLTGEKMVAHYYSRSRKKLWLKGETSGNIQKVQEIRLDCDGDTILLKVTQAGGACHEGYRSCFFRKWANGSWAVDGKKIFDPDKIYGHKK
ncbi:MAG: phosphoribosyl-AMP cyclohydrolase [Candidatus Sumerlaeota bacterium]|nr:phosphoribosyl-AMP cyclohydrolase [Candidatus Sumerlaeota bacterium]